MKTISAKRLEMASACEDQVGLFRSEWGDEAVPLTPENWDRAKKIGLDRLWMCRFLSDAAQAECEKACEAAWAEFAKVRVAAWAEYHKVCAAAWAECDEVCAAALFAALTKRNPQRSISK